MKGRQDGEGKAQNKRWKGRPRKYVRGNYTERNWQRERKERDWEKKNSNQHLPLSSYILSKRHSTQRRFPACLTTLTSLLQYVFETIYQILSDSQAFFHWAPLLHQHEISIKTVIQKPQTYSPQCPQWSCGLIKNFSMPLSVTAVYVPSWIYMLLKTITGRTSFTSSAKFVA